MNTIPDSIAKVADIFADILREANRLEAEVVCSNVEILKPKRERDELQAKLDAIEARLEDVGVAWAASIERTKFADADRCRYDAQTTYDLWFHAQPEPSEPEAWVLCDALGVFKFHDMYNTGREHMAMGYCDGKGWEWQALDEARANPGTKIALRKREVAG